MDPAGKTFTALTYEAQIPPLSDTVVQLLNVDTMAAATATFPATYKSSCNLPLQRLNLSNSLTVGYGQALLIVWQSGGIPQDVEIVLE
jgi:hypothetical protein